LENFGKIFLWLGKLLIREIWGLSPIWTRTGSAARARRSPPGQESFPSRVPARKIEKLGLIFINARRLALRRPDRDMPHAGTTRAPGVAPSGSGYASCRHHAGAWRVRAGWVDRGVGPDDPTVSEVVSGAPEHVRAGRVLNDEHFRFSEFPGPGWPFR
jgi:hypothetical protein